MYFELDPRFDDYPASPATWRTLQTLAHPSSTVLLAEGATRADHAMAHFWEGNSGGGEIAKRRHGNGSHYAFADGHVELLPFAATWAGISPYDGHIVPATRSGVEARVGIITQFSCHAPVP